MIEFLTSLIEGSQYSQDVSYAVAPLLMQALAFGTQLAKGKQALNQLESDIAAQQGFVSRDAEKAAAQRALLERGELEFAPAEQKVSDKAYEAYNISQSRAAEDEMRRQQDAALATLAASGSPMGSGMYNQFVNQGAKAALATQSQRMKGAQDLGTAETQVSGLNAQLRERARMRELQNMLNRERAAEIGKYKIQQQQGQLQQGQKNLFTNALLDTLPGVIGAADSSGLFSKGPGKDSPTALTAEQLGLNQIKTVGDTPFLTNPLNLQNVNMPTDVEVPVVGADLNLGAYSNVSLLNPQDPYSLANRAGLGFRKEHGGKLSYEHGGEVLETEGEFNHDTNKKALIDEETGMKEAELTGGELVFNPEQTSILEELVSLGDEEALMGFLKELMNEPQFKG